MRSFIDKYHWAITNATDLRPVFPNSAFSIIFVSFCSIGKPHSLRAAKDKSVDIISMFS